MNKMHHSAMYELCTSSIANLILIFRKIDIFTVIYAKVD